MSTMITCPSCSTKFEPTDAIAQSIEKEMRSKMEVEWRKRMDTLQAEKHQLEQMQKELSLQKEAQEAELKKRVDDACREREVVIGKELQEKLRGDFQHQLETLKEANKEHEDRLKEARQKEIEFLKKMQEMQDLKTKLELDAQKQLMEERHKVALEIRKQEDERYKLKEQDHQMKLKELEMQLEVQRKLAEEALRKAEQGSMQLQGEVQEVALEDLLRQAFPLDKVSEVGKGVRGADCVLTVRNAFGQECGCIIFESKRTKDFGTDWIAKLKHDMVGCAADIAVIVSQVMPKDMDRFGEKNGVYICNFQEVKSLVTVLRQAILKVFEARKSQENKGDKMVMLYDYLTGIEFMGQWNAMRDGFRKFRATLQKEREDFEKNWKKKEKLLDVIINNSLQISGSIEGISGMESMNWNALPEENGLLLD